MTVESVHKLENDDEHRTMLSMRIVTEGLRSDQLEELTLTDYFLRKIEPSRIDNLGK